MYIRIYIYTHILFLYIYNIEYFQLQHVSRVLWPCPLEGDKFFVSKMASQPRWSNAAAMACWRFEVGSTVAVEGLWNRGTTGHLTQKEKLKVT